MNSFMAVRRVSVRLLAAFGVGVLLAPVVAPAAVATETNAPFHFTNAQDRFSITLPAGWQAMPSALAEAMSDPIQAAQPGGLGAYGFELAANTNSLTPPYVTVQVVRSGRVGDGYIRMLNNPEVCRRAVLDLVRKDGMEARDLADFSWETNRLRLRLSGTREDESGGRVRFWHDLTFTEHGSINVTCIAEEADAKRWEAAFSGVLDSLQINSFDAYQPREGPSTLAGVKFRATKVMLIPGFMVVLGLARLISHRFSDRVMSDEI